MFQKKVVKVLSISIAGILLAFGLSQSGFQTLQVQNTQLSTQNVGSCAGNTCHRVQIDNMIFDGPFIHIATSGDEAGIDSNICGLIDHGTFGKLIVVERGEDDVFTTLLAHKLSNLPVSFGVEPSRPSYGAVCQIDWLSAPRQ